MKLSWNIDSHFQLSTVLVFLPNHAYYVADVGQEVMGWLQQQVLIAIHSAGRGGKITLLAELIHKNLRKTFALFRRKTGLNLSSYNRHMTKTKIIIISDSVGKKTQNQFQSKSALGDFITWWWLGTFRSFRAVLQPHLRQWSMDYGILWKMYFHQNFARFKFEGFLLFSYWELPKLNLLLRYYGYSMSIAIFHSPWTTVMPI